MKTTLKNIIAIIAVVLLVLGIASNAYEWFEHFNDPLTVGLKLKMYWRGTVAMILAVLLLMYSTTD